MAVAAATVGRTGSPAAPTAALHPNRFAPLRVRKQTMHRPAALVLALTLPIGLPLAAAVASGCGDADATSGKRVVLHTAVDTKPGPYAARNGWSVELSKARLGVASFHFFDGPPVVAAVDPPWRALFLKTAHAHPGHYQEGTALGQMLVPETIDLLGGGQKLPDGDGVTGTGRSARFTVGKGDLGSFVAVVEGTAKKTGAPDVHFRLVATPDELERTAVGGKVEGCPFGPAEIGGDGTVTATVDPSVWFGFVDFAGVGPGTPDTPTEPAATDEARIGFVLGLGQATAYRFAFSSP